MIPLDDNIIKRCRAKDKRAQRQLYEIFYKRVYNSCYRLLRNQYEAEDAMQESFIKAFMKLDKYDEEISFETWLVRIAINTSIDKLRENRLDLVNINEEVNYIGEESLCFEEEFILQQASLIKKIIKSMKGINQIILSLYLIEGYDHEEIAEILNIKAATSRVKYMRAKQELLGIIKKEAVKCGI